MLCTENYHQSSHKLPIFTHNICQKSLHSSKNLLCHEECITLHISCAQNKITAPKLAQEWAIKGIQLPRTEQLKDLWLGSMAHFKVWAASFITYHPYFISADTLLYTYVEKWNVRSLKDTVHY